MKKSLQVSYLLGDKIIKLSNTVVLLMMYVSMVMCKSSKPLDETIKKQLEDKDKEIVELKQKLSDLEVDYAKISTNPSLLFVKNLEETLQRVTQQLSEGNDKIEDLEKENAMWKNSNKTVIITALHKEISVLKSDKILLTEEIKRLRDEVAKPKVP